MAMRIKRSGFKSVDALPPSWLRNAGVPRVEHLVDSDDGTSDSSTDKPSQQSTRDRAAFEESLAARGVDGRIVEQIGDLVDQLNDSESPWASHLLEILFEAINVDGVHINRQFVDTVSMLADAIVEGGLSDQQAERVLGRLIEMLDDGRLTRREHSELQALINAPDSADAQQPGRAAADLTEPHGAEKVATAASRVQTPTVEKRHTDASAEPEPASPATGSEEPVDDLSEIFGSAPTATNVDPQQWDAEYGLSDGTPGLTGVEFIFALYGSGVMSSLSPVEQLEFGRYATSLFTVYANDEQLLFDEEIALMQDDGILVETEEGWTLDFETVTELVDPAAEPMPIWLPAPAPWLKDLPNEAGIGDGGTADGGSEEK